MISFLLFFLLVCNNNPSERDLFEAQCMVLFEDILYIQDKRDYLNNEMQYITKLRKEKSISKKKYKAISDEWFKKEAYLGSRVTKLYDKAYDKGCFEERPNFLERK